MQEKLRQATQTSDTETSAAPRVVEGLLYALQPSMLAYRPWNMF
jgi:hypothetical protein